MSLSNNIDNFLTIEDKAGNYCIRFEVFEVFDIPEVTVFNVFVEKNLGANVVIQHIGTGPSDFEDFLSGIWESFFADFFNGNSTEFNFRNTTCKCNNIPKDDADSPNGITADRQQNFNSGKTVQFEHFKHFLQFCLDTHY